MRPAFARVLFECILADLNIHVGAPPSESPFMIVLLMDKILHYPFFGIHHNSHSLGSLGSCRIFSINSII